MLKNLSTPQLLLIVLASLVLLLAAFSFYLLQDPTAPLPFAPPPPPSTFTPLPPTLTFTPSPSSTTIPTRQTSYTPFASPPVTESITTTEMMDAPTPVLPVTSVTPFSLPTNTSTVQPSPPNPNPLTATPSPTGSTPSPSQTLAPGEYEVTGRVVQNGTPIANVIVAFTDDDPSRKRTTNSGGHYSFITLAPGTFFTLEFVQSDNPQLTPVPNFSSLAWLEGSLPTGNTHIELPDLEVSLSVDGMNFVLLTPVDRSSFSANAISQSNPLQFVWSLYNDADSYHIELGELGTDVPLWFTSETALTNLMWNGTLDDGTHITDGTYWWSVVASKALGSYKQIVFTQKFTLIFTP